MSQAVVSVCAAALVACIGCGAIQVESSESLGSDVATADPSSDTIGAETTAAHTPTNTDADTGTTSSQGADGTTEDDAPRLDVAAYPDLGTDAGCDAIDFLFVIDDSGSMGPYQAALIDSFPAFVAGIQASLETVDGFHVAVTTSDAYVYNSPECGWLGSSVVSTGGAESSQQQCGPYAAGHNYMTDADDLPAQFACAAQVGTGGDPIERPMGALVNAMANTTPGTEPCNDDFIRANALLVVVIITDEYDGPDDPEGYGSIGDPQSWYDAVVAAKNGIADNAAVVSLANYEGGPCEPRNQGFDGVNIIEFTEMFGDHGFVAGICEPDYAASFADAVEVVVDACADFVPPG